MSATTPSPSISAGTLKTSQSEVAPSTPTPRPSHDSTATVQSRGASSSTTKGKKKKKKKRAKDPKDFELWRAEDKQCYNAVTYALRHWKATRRQCHYIRTSIGRWEAFRRQLKGHPAHAQEMCSYFRALKDFVPIDDGKSFDLEE